MTLPDVSFPPPLVDRNSPEGRSRGPWYIQDKLATSYEYNVARALEKLDLEFEFQVSFFGGRRLRGGIIVDFWVFTKPLPTPLWVHGEYWHKGRQRTIDLMQQATLFAFLAGAAAQGVVLWGQDVETEEKALRACRREFL